jgi:hypothetical protein
MVKKNIFRTVGILTIAYLLFRKKSNAMTTTNSGSGSSGSSGSENPIPDQMIVDAFRKIFNIYGREKTQRLEQLFRWETNHFRSGQFKGTFSPGMEPSPNTNRTFPFGWSSLRNFATAKGYASNQFNVSGPYREGGTGIPKYFVKFPDLFSSMLFVMYVIEKRGWNFGKWRAFDETISNDYNNKLNTVIPRITNTF